MIGTCENCKHKVSCAVEGEIPLEEFLRIAKFFNWSDIDCIDYEKEE